VNTKILKIAIVVHGRFQAFELVRELVSDGHNVCLFTNYPKFAVKRFGIDPGNVRSFLLHGIVSRAAWFLHEKLNILYPEAWLHRMFGRWSATEVLKESWDVIHCWSGISEEILLSAKNRDALKILMRCSSHISTQERLLREERARTGIPIRLPSRWMIEREKREYALADYIRVLSQFAYKSFIEEGVNKEKIILISAAAPIKNFRPLPEIAQERCERITRGTPLKVLYVGTFSFQKGMWDMTVICEKLKRQNFKFRFIGPIDSNAKSLSENMRGFAEFISKQPQFELPKWYAWADIFMFPTIQDGHAQVLAQAQASGLPILTTTNCQGPDVIVQGKTGWVLPIRSPDAFIDRLKWCDSHRNELVEMVKNVYENYKPKGWNDVAADFIDVCTNLKEKHR
jgi:glycosyltransferase involved in cell wall biosynthesis